MLAPKYFVMWTDSCPIEIVIGFTQTQYTVTRKDSYVTFNVSILGGATIQGASVGVMFSTGDGTALGKCVAY